MLWVLILSVLLTLTSVRCPPPLSIDAPVNVSTASHAFTAASPAAAAAAAAGSAFVSLPGRGEEGDADPAAETTDWVCPDIRSQTNGTSDGQVVSCSCDLPHTLRCTGGPDTLQLVGDALRALPPRYASLLDATVAGMSTLAGPVLEGVSLHGLVVSGELRSVHPSAFSRILQQDAEPRLQALGLPGNLLNAVPNAALQALPGLERLDLSHNRLRTLPANSFKGVHNLTFLDLSDNQLTDISPTAMFSLTSLRVLRLTGNRLQVFPVSFLEGLRSLVELDLSSNQLAGQLGPAALPRLVNLRTLNLAHNQVSSVRRGALAGLPTLSSLSLPHNMVDVLEDYAFQELGTLTSLDLAYNRIVAVSETSLVHLGRLRTLSLQHNFLRALSADLVRPLSSLENLHLDDNDISMVAPDALPFAGRLSRLTLSENPLNCDCALAPFAGWLHNASKLSAVDRATAVCAAPPHLENGLLEDVAVAELLCQDFPGDEVEHFGPGGRSHPLSDTRVTLRAFQFDGTRVSLLWGVDSSAAPYVCDALFVYEEAGPHELLLESTPLGCDSSQLADPRSLLLFLPATRLVTSGKYRFCLVLLAGGGAQDDLALVFGCSDVLSLVKTSGPRHTASSTNNSQSPRISGLSANLTSKGSLAVWVQLTSASSSASASPSPGCRLAVTVFAAGTLAAEERLNCSLPGAVISGLGQDPGPLQVCATAGESARTRCISVLGRKAPASATSVSAGLTAAVAGIAAAAGAALCITLWLASRWKRRDRGSLCGMATPQDAGQLYRPPPSTDSDQQHTRYVKLQATTKL